VAALGFGPLGLLSKDLIFVLTQSKYPSCERVSAAIFDVF